MTNKTIAQAPIEIVTRTPITFTNQDSGLVLAGIVFTPKGLKETDKLPALVVGGPMLSAKELTQSLYAQFMAEKGYVTMVFDNSHIGSSQGSPRGLEDPEIKGSDLRSAISFLETLPYVDSDRIGGIGICGSGVYYPHGVRNDARMKAVASIVPFTVMEYVRTASDEDLLAEKVAYENGAEPSRLDLVTGSDVAAYYEDVERGAAANMVNPVSWSQLSWHNFHPIETISELKVPYMVVTGENAFTRQGAEALYANANEPKELHVLEGADHIDLYDVKEYVDQALNHLETFFNKYL